VKAIINLFSRLSKPLCFIGMLWISMVTYAEDEAKKQISDIHLTDKEAEQQETNSNETTENESVTEESANQSQDTDEIENDNVKEKKESKSKQPLSEVEQMKIKIEQLQSSLNNDSQENATLRQHMDVLLKKLEENQRTIKEFDSEQTESN